MLSSIYYSGPFSGWRRKWDYGLEGYKVIQSDFTLKRCVVSPFAPGLLIRQISFRGLSETNQPPIRSLFEWRKLPRCPSNLSKSYMYSQCKWQLSKFSHYFFIHPVLSIYCKLPNRLFFS